MHELNPEKRQNQTVKFELLVNDKYRLVELDKSTASQHADILANLADQIPLVDYKPEQILADGKPDGSRTYHGKWEHSLILFDEDKPIGCVMGYERASENNSQYPQDSIYISELAVDPDYQGQGLGRQLVENFMKRSTHIGMTELDSPISFSIQTNSDKQINGHVIGLYHKLGFTDRATKEYDNRTDLVMGYTSKP